jgi:alkanesulfonate monooxygenase SsuD/methylene tetrahydromethanopterin reductase-like flavin-dependent oxidoreductase (luciferase family)
VSSGRASVHPSRCALAHERFPPAELVRQAAAAEQAAFDGVCCSDRRAAEAGGREPGEIVLQTLASWAPTDEDALAASREWKGTLVDEHYLDPIADPVQIGKNGEELPDTTFESKSIVSADPEQHVKKLRKAREAGASTVVVMNVSAADPEGALRVYGEQVLPELRGA